MAVFSNITDSCRAFSASVVLHLSLLLFSNLAESREGKCPVVSDELAGCGHSRTSSYASQQSKLSGKAVSAWK